jgi:hypothetical protein
MKTFFSLINFEAKVILNFFFGKKNFFEGKMLKKSGEALQKMSVSIKDDISM